MLFQVPAILIIVVLLLCGAIYVAKGCVKAVKRCFHWFFALSA